MRRKIIMKENTLNFIKGFGSILNIYPSSKNYDCPASKLTVEQRLQQSWDSVKHAFEKAVGDFDEEVNEKQKGK